MSEPLRYRRRRRLAASRTCRACGASIQRTATAEEFWAGPNASEVFHPSCAPTTLPSVLVCPDCLGDMVTPSRWDSLRGSRKYDVPVCRRCQAGAA